MSRKGKKRAKQRYRQQTRPAGPLTPAGTGQAGVAPTRSVSQARVGGDQAMVRAVEMSLGARNQVMKRRGGGFIVHSADPAIPLDRVPYFTSDLKRLAFVGVGMLVLLTAGSFAIPHIVK